MSPEISMQKEISPGRRRFLRTTALAVAATQFDVGSFARASSEVLSLDRATAWLNSEPPIERQLQGKVSLIEFWTYSCINWRRQLPYVRAWAERYKSHGLVVVGVHSPEFSFERNPDNVRWAANNMDIRYPIAIDNEYSIWRAFNNNYWPALYFIDVKGRIRHHVFGEGQYAQSEVTIQKLLIEGGATGVGDGLVSIEPRGTEAAADWKELRSGENYVGYARTQNFASSGGIRGDKPHVYSEPDRLALNEWAISGDWTFGGESILLNRPGGNISYRFHARDLHAVLGPSAPGRQIRFRALIDGKSPGADHGLDIDDQGNGRVIEPRMYQIVRQQSHIADRQITIQFLDAGIQAFSFTFG